MRTLVKCAGALAALAISSACSSGSPVAPSSAALNPTFKSVGPTLFVNGRPVTAARLSAMPRYATIAPDHRGRKKFEYVFNNYETYASIFDYPKSVQQIGSIYGDGGQGCTNVLYGYGKKTFWNVGGPTQITEYKVPHTPIKTLTTVYHSPSSCAMNSNGDLAVGILFSQYPSRGGGDVLIFKNASGSPTDYSTPLHREYFDGYDDKGNLFADGFPSRSYNFTLVELPRGGSKFKIITTSNKVQFPGSVQWDGTYLTVLDQLANALYQYTVSGSEAKLKGTVQLTGSADCAQTWIVTGLIYCADAGNNYGEVFKYPAGGSPIAVFTGNFDFPLGVVAAQK